MTDSWDAVDGYDPDAGRQERVDRIRVRGYGVACVERAKALSVQVERAVDALTRAREDAERTAMDFEFAMEQAEMVARVIASDDAAWTSEVAASLEELFG